MYAQRGSASGFWDSTFSSPSEATEFITNSMEPQVRRWLDFSKRVHQSQEDMRVRNKAYVQVSELVESAKGLPESWDFSDFKRDVSKIVTSLIMSYDLVTASAAIHGFRFTRGEVKSMLEDVEKIYHSRSLSRDGDGTPGPKSDA